MEVEEGFEFTSEMDSGQNALPLFFFVCSLFFWRNGGKEMRESHNDGYAGQGRDLGKICNRQWPLLGSLLLAR